MSKGHKRADRQRIRSPSTKCAEGHCTNPLRKGFEWASCSKFLTLQTLCLTPLDCPYYKQ